MRLIQIASAEGTEVENTTTEGSFARKVFAANELSPGKVFKGAGVVKVNDNNSTDTLVVAWRFGTADAPASNTDCGRSAATDVADGDLAVATFELHVLTTTSAVIITKVQTPDAAGTGAVVEFAAELTIAADTAYNLDLTGTWSVAHADNEAAAASFAVSELN